MEQYQKRMSDTRDREKLTLHEELEKHQENLNKIDQMSRALRFQYSELRRHHLTLRAQISANKLSLKEVGGQPHKGTDFDIEGPAPRDLEDIESIPSEHLNPRLGTSIQSTLNEQYAKNMRTLRDSQQRQRDALQQFLTGKPTAVHRAKEVESPFHNVKSKVEIEKLIKKAITESESGESSSAHSSVSSIMSALSSSSSSGYLSRGDVDGLLKLLEELLEQLKRKPQSSSSSSSSSGAEEKQKLAEQKKKAEEEQKKKKAEEQKAKNRPILKKKRLAALEKQLKDASDKKEEEWFKKLPAMFRATIAGDRAAQRAKDKKRHAETEQEAKKQVEEEDTKRKFGF